MPEVFSGRLYAMFHGDPRRTGATQLLQAPVITNARQRP
jgi:hypothetical protein